MRRRILSILVMCFLYLHTSRLVAAQQRVTLPARIDAIEIRGLVRTHEFVVLRELTFRPGDVVTQKQLARSVSRLWDLPLFATVHASVVRERGRVVAVFDLEEKWPLMPILEFESGGHALWFHVGASYHNLLGRYLEVEGFYEYFNGQPGGSLWFQDNRLFDQRLVLRVTTERLNRPRPAYVVRTTHARLDLDRLALDDVIDYGLGVEALADDFSQPLEGQSAALPDTVDVFLAEPHLRVGRIDRVRLRERGVSLDTRVAVGHTTRADAPTFKRVTSTLTAKAMLGSRWNPAARILAGSVTSRPDELEMWIGGLDLLRGYHDNFFKATSWVVYNAELRFIVFDTRWLAMKLTAFSDGALVGKDDGTRDAAASVGAGIVFEIPKLTDSQLRFDLAIPLRGPHHPDLNMGSNKFF